MGGWMLIQSLNDDHSVVDTVERYYRDNNGLLANYPGENEEIEYLSESLGLYLNYLILSREKEEFENEFLHLSSYLEKVYSGNLVRWKVENGVSVNALIDDVRIAYALLEAASVFNEPKYEELSKTIQSALYHNQYYQQNWHDFYDWKINVRSEEVHFSYFNQEAWSAFNWDDDGLDLLLLAQDGDNVFYFEKYLTQTNEPVYYNSEQINLIDQILIMTQVETYTGEVQPLEGWLNNTYEENGRLVGRYSRTNGKELVSYESPAVYSLLILHYVTKNDVETAFTWSEPLKRIHDEVPSDKTHFFDYMLATLALETLERSSKEG